MNTLQNIDETEELWDVGKRYGISLTSIRDINGMADVPECDLPWMEVEKGKKLLLVRS